MFFLIIKLPILLVVTHTDGAIVNGDGEGNDDENEEGKSEDIFEESGSWRQYDHQKVLTAWQLVTYLTKCFPTLLS